MYYEEQIQDLWRATADVLGIINPCDVFGGGGWLWGWSGSASSFWMKNMISTVLTKKSRVYSHPEIDDQNIIQVSDYCAQVSIISAPTALSALFRISQQTSLHEFCLQFLLSVSLCGLFIVLIIYISHCVAFISSLNTRHPLLYAMFFSVTWLCHIFFLAWTPSKQRFRFQGTILVKQAKQASSLPAMTANIFVHLVSPCHRDKTWS